MNNVLSEIENRKKAFKAELEELAKNTKENSKELEYLNKWLHSDDFKLISVATSYIDELGDTRPELCLQFNQRLIELLNHSRNRIIWSSLTALESYAQINSEYLFSHLDKIILASEKSTVVAKDHAVQIYQKLAKEEKYYETCIQLMLEQIRVCATNQLGQYAERALDVIKKDDLEELIESLRLRLPSIENPHQIRRAEKIIDIARKKRSSK